LSAMRLGRKTRFCRRPNDFKRAYEEIVKF
jgi:hypothetical protein